MSRYDDILSALFVRFPSVQKDGFGASAYKPGLGHMESFDNILGRPSESLRFIHVAGTNGKGSVSSMLASALAAQGMRVGLYTSPHLLDFRERMRIVSDEGVELIPKDKVLSFVDKWSKTFDDLDLSFFEITTGMALDWFAAGDVDFAIMEVGLGGRLDSTNIIIPELAVVTSIGLDHCAQLGNTRALIAGEKAGIFKSGVPALVGVWDEETAPVFESHAQDVHCPLFFADEYASECFDELPPLGDFDLKGEYQQINVATVLSALDILGFDADIDAIEHTAARTGFRGRWERLGEAPLTICDIGHNPPALKINFAQLDEMMATGMYDKLVIIYGVMADKALDDIVPLMPQKAVYIFATADTPRAMPSGAIIEHYRANGGRCEAHVTDSVPEALDFAATITTPQSLLYIGGSTFVVADALKCENQK